jgi:hypothetical protein
MIGRRLLVAAVFAAALATAGGATAAEVLKFSATASWRGLGQVFDLGDGKALFVGAFEGTMFVDAGGGTLDASHFVCPGTFEIDTASGEQTGEGKCIVNGGGGDRLFARWECAGHPRQGCRGSFSIFGGGGRFAKAKGTSEMVVRGTRPKFDFSQQGGRLQEFAQGLAFWPELTIELP